MSFFSKIQKVLLLKNNHLYRKSIGIGRSLLMVLIALSLIGCQEENQDSEEAKIVKSMAVSSISGNTSENGDSASFSVKLTSAPSSDVDIDVVSLDTGEGTVDKPKLTFTNSNWRDDQTVTVIGVDDNIVDGAQNYTVQLSVNASTKDQGYLGVDPVKVSVTNADSGDIAGFNISPISGSTSEIGTSATFNINLTSDPADVVYINVNSSDSSEGYVDTTLEFNSGNWNFPQEVEVIGVDDNIVDGPQQYTIELSIDPSTKDEVYSSISPSNLDVTNDDEGDVADLSVTEINGHTSEDGTSSSFAVRLTSEPLGIVSINVVSSDPTEGTIRESSLEFDSSIWNVDQTVDVIGVDDQMKDGDQQYTIDLSINMSSTTAEEYKKDPPILYSVDVTNDDYGDVPGLDISGVTGQTSEDETTTATFSVRLATQPSGLVYVDVASLDPGEGVVNPSPLSLQFNGTNWNTYQTVTVIGVNDNIEDGNQDYMIGLTIDTTNTTDSDYDLVGQSFATVTNVDQGDTAGFVVGPISGNTSESGIRASFELNLTSDPSDDVYISVISLDPDEGYVDTTIKFDSGNWDIPQAIEVVGVDDNIMDGPQIYTIELSIDASTDDEVYLGISPPNFDMTNDDDSDFADFDIAAVSGQTGENDITADFEVRLTSEPSSGNVIINISSSDTGEGTVSPATLTFDSTNWNLYRTVIVTGVDDFIVDGNQEFTIDLTSSSSTNANEYLGISSNFLVTNNDFGDVAGFNVGAINSHTTEAGGTAYFDVSLTSEPSDDVNISFISSDPGEGQVETRLNFTSLNWNIDQPVTVVGVDDDAVDGEQAYYIELVIDSSTDDGVYSALTPDLMVAVINWDDADTAGFEISAISGSTSENDATADFTVRLTSDPSGDVHINVVSLDPNEGTVDKPRLSFNSANWNINQTVTVTGVDDSSADGDKEYFIGLTVDAGSEDGNYLILDPSDVSVTNIDNDYASIDVVVSASKMRFRDVQALVAIGTAVDDSTVDISDSVLWESSDPNLVSIDAKGLASALGSGTVSVSANSGAGVTSASKSLTVLKPTLVGISTVDGGLYRIDESNGSTSFIRSITDSPLDSETIDPSSDLRSLVFDASSGALYAGTAGDAVCPTCLFSIDLATGSASFFKDLQYDVNIDPVGTIYGMDIDSTGDLYFIAMGIAEDALFMTPTDGSRDSQKILEFENASIGNGLAFNSSGALSWISDIGLYTINTANGTNNKVGDLSADFSVNAPHAIAINPDDGKAYGLDIDGQFFEVNLSNAELNFITEDSLKLDGLSYIYGAQNIPPSIKLNQSAIEVFVNDPLAVTPGFWDDVNSAEELSTVYQLTDSSCSNTFSDGDILGYDIPSVSLTPDAIGNCTLDIKVTDLDGSSTNRELTISSLGRWSSKTRMRYDRYALTANNVNGKIYAMGGSSTSTLRDKVEEYDPTTDTWIDKTLMPFARHSFSSNVVNGKIYVFAGYNAGATGRLDVYDPSNDTWVAEGNLPVAVPTPRYMHSSHVVDGIIYVIGGRNASNTYIGSVEAYDPSTDQWNSVPKASMPTPRGSFASAVVNGKIYIIGGEDSSGRLSSVEVYDPSTDTWTSGTSLDMTNFSFAAAVVNNNIFVFGGHVGSATRLSTVKSFDPSTDTAWQDRTSMPSGRSGLATAVVDGMIYIIGGYNNNASLDGVEVYAPEFN